MSAWSHTHIPTCPYPKCPISRRYKVRAISRLKYMRAMDAYPKEISLIKILMRYLSLGKNVRKINQNNFLRGLVYPTTGLFGFSLKKLLRNNIAEVSLMVKTFLQKRPYRAQQHSSSCKFHSNFLYYKDKAIENF